MLKNPHTSAVPTSKTLGKKGASAIPDSFETRVIHAKKHSLEVLEGRIAPASAFSTQVLNLNPEAYYQLGETSGTTAVDASGNGLHGIYSGSPTFGQPGQILDTTAVGFNGATYANIPLSISSTFTIAGWIKTNSAGGVGGQWYNGAGLIDGEVGGVTNDFGTSILNGRFAFGVGNSDVTVQSSQSVADGNWHFVVATRDAGTGAMAVYVDGALGGTATGPTGAKTTPPTLRIGGMQTGVSYYTGTIDDVALFSTALTAGQISDLYAAGLETYTTDVAISGADLTITDGDGGASNDNLVLKLIGSDLQITDIDGALLNVSGIVGATGAGTSTVTVPLSAWAGALVFNSLGGNDKLTLDLTGGDFIPNAGLVFNGGNPTTAPGDQLVITGGNQGTVTYNYTNANDGSIGMSNFGTVTYTGLEPITNDGTASDIIFNLPAGPNAATLSDDGTLGNGLSRLSGATFELTDFSNPSGSITINRGSASDTITVNAAGDLTSAVALGSGASPFAQINLNANVAGALSGGTPLVNVTAPGSIQDGISVAINGGTVNVSAGTFSENLVLNKDLTLLGAQAGVDARGRVVGAPNPATETVITGAGLLLSVVGGSAGSTIDGFAFSGGDRHIESGGGPLDNLILANNSFGGFANAAIFLNDPGLNITITRNSVDGSAKIGGGGLVHLDTDNFNGFHLTNNWIQNGASATGFFVDGDHNVGASGLRAPLIQGNLVSGNNTGMNLGRFSFTGGEISENTFTASTFDGLQGGIQNSLVARNTFSGNGRSGLALTGFGGAADPTRGAQNSVITQNVFAGNAVEDLFLSAGQFPGTISTNTIIGNSFASATGLTYGGAEIINASGNWWNNPTGPTVATRPGGAGAVIGGLGAANVDHTPWLNSGADINGGLAGFQGDFSFLNVDDNSPQAGVGGRINEAVGLLANGALVGTNRTINAQPGVYAEAVDLAVAATLNLAGNITVNSLAGIAGTVVQLNVNTLTAGNASNTTYGGLIVGGGGLTKVGAGTLTLTENNTYTGTTTVNAGTLQPIGTNTLKGAIGNSSSIIVNSGGTIASGNTAGVGFDNGMFGQVPTGTITINTGGTISMIGGLSQHLPHVVMAGGTLSVIGAPSGSALVHGNFNLDQGVSTPGTGVISTISGGWLTTSQSGGTILNVGAGDTLTISSVLADAPAVAETNLVKTGAGTLTLSGANTYLVATVVNGGTLKAGVASVANVSGAFGNNSAVTLANTAGAILDITGFNTQIGSLTGGGSTGGNVILGAATLTIGGNNSSPAAYAGAISGSGAVTKIGTGTLNLTGVNTYTGATSINAGTLRVNGSVTSNVTVTSPGTLGGSGTITGNVAGNGTVAAGNSPGVLTISGDFTPTGTVSFEVNSPYNTAGTDYDQIVVGGNVNLSGATLAFTGGVAAPAPQQLLTLISKTSAGLTTASASPAEGSTVTLGSAVFTIYYNGGDGNDVVLVDASTPTVVYVEDTAWSALTNGTVIADADFGTAGNQPAVYGVNAFSNITAGIGAVTASGQLIVNAGTYAEAVSLNGTKTLTVTSAASVTTSSFASIAGTTLQINGTGFTTGNASSTTIAGLITGSGSLTKQGSGTLTLTGANTYTGSTQVNAGNLNIQHATALGTTAGGTTVASGAALQLQGGITVTGEPLTINGSGSGVGDGALRNVSGSNTWTGNISAVPTGGFARIFSDTGNLAISGNVALGGAGTDALVLGGNGTGTISGIISGLGNVIKSSNGTGTWTLSGNNTYDGTTSVSNGILQIGAGGATGTLGDGGATIAAGATLRFNRSNSISVPNTISGGGTLSVVNSGGITFTSTVSAGTISLLNTTGTIAFDQSVTAGTLTTANQAYSVVFNGNATVTNTVAFLNTGTVTLGNGGDTLSFAGGLSTVGNASNPSLTNLASALSSTGTLIRLGNVALLSNSSVSTGAGALTFAGTINGAFNLAANSSAATSFSDAVGGSTPLASLTTNATGTTTLSANVTTSGGQTYGDNVVLGASVSLVSVGGGTIAFGGTINGAAANTQSLTIDSGTGAITFGGAIGGTASLANLTTTSGSAALVLPAVTLGGNLSVTTTGGAVSQTGILTVGGTSTIAAGAASIALTAANDFIGVVNASVTGANNITINDAVGNLVLGVVTAANQTVTLSSTGGQITDAAAGNNVTAQTLNLSASSGIGVTGGFGAIDTTVSFLKAITGTGGIAVDNTGALTITDTGAFATAGGARVTGVSGGITIRALSPLTVAANVVSPGAILLSASESAAAGDDLTVNAGVVVQSTGSSVTLNAGDNIVLNGGIAPQISAATTVTLDAANGDVDNLGGITANGSILAGGLVTLTARDTIALGADVASTGGNLTYTSTQGAITRSAGTSSGNLLTANAAAGITLTTAVATLNLTNTTSGNIAVTEADGVDVALAVTQAGNGSITIGNTAPGANIQLTGLVSAHGSGNIDLLAQGDLTLNDVVLGDDVTSGTGNIALRGNAGVHFNDARVSTLGSGLIDADANLASNTGPVTTGVNGHVTANALVIHAAEGITLNTSVNTLTATNTFSGAITINETNGVALNQVSNPGRDIFISLTAGAITDNNGIAQNVLGAGARLIAPAGVGTLADRIETTLTNLEAQATSTGIFVAETDALTIGGVTITNGVNAATAPVDISSGSLTLAEDVTTTGTVTFTSTGSVTETTGAVKSASLLRIDSANGQTLTGANTVGSFDSTNSSSGDVSLFNTTGTLTVVRIANLVGNASVTNSNNVQLGDSTGQNVNVGGIATIIASAGAITDGHTPTPDDGTPINNITGAGAVLSATTTIGALANVIETNIGNLEASSGAGGVFVTESDALVVGGISGMNGVSSTTGQIRIVSGPLTIQERIGTAGNVTLTASGPIDEIGAGFISAALLTTQSNGGQDLDGPNTVATFTATNTGAGTGVVFENTFNGFTISTVTSATGGDIFINNAGNGATITGVIRSGNPVLGGDITIQTAGVLNVNATVDSRGGSGGTLTLGGQINVNASPIVGFGDVTLQGGPGNLNIFAPISVSSPLVLQATGDVNILAKVETTSVLSDITVLADLDGNGTGGVYIGAGTGGNQGQLKAGRNLDVRGSEYLGSAAGTGGIANQDNSVVIQPNGTTPRLEAVGSILVKNNGSAPFDARIWLGGLVRSNTDGDIAFDNAIYLTSNDARVHSHSDGDVIFLGAVDNRTTDAGIFDLRIAGGTGVVLFNAPVGATNAIRDVIIESALDVTVTSSLTARTFTIVDATGTVEFGGAVTTNGAGTNLSVNAVNLLVNGPIVANAPAALLGDILLQVNNIAIANTIASDGVLTIQPQDVDRSIGLNEAGDLNLDSGELDLLQNGFSQILIGRSNGTGLLSIGDRTGLNSWQDPVVFRSPGAGGAIDLLGQTAGVGDASFTFLSPAITVDVPVTPTISTAGGFVQIGAFTLNAATVLESDLEIVTSGGAVTVVGTINGEQGLSIDAGAGAVYINGNTTPVPTGTSIGGEVPLSSIEISGGLLTLRPNMRSQGTQEYTGSSIHLLGGDFRTFTDGGGAVTFNGPVVLEHSIVIQTTNSEIEFLGSVDNVALHTTLAGRGALRLNAGAGAITFADDVGQTFAPKTIEVVSAGLVQIGNDGADIFEGGLSVTIVAEEVDLDGDVSVPGGILSITNKLDAQGITVGGVETLGSPELELSDTDLAALGDGTATIIIGRRAGSGTAPLLIADTATFNDPVIFQQPSKTSGPITVNGDLIGLGNGGFTFNGPATQLNADITTAGGTVNIENAVGMASLSTIDTSAGNGAVTFRGLLTGFAGGEDITVIAGTGTIHVNTSARTPLTGILLGTLTLDSDGLTRIERGLTVGALVVEGDGIVALKGSITTTEAGGQNYDNAVRLIGAVNLTSLHADGVIRFGDTVDSDPAQLTRQHNLSITNRSESPAGTTVEFDGAIGSVKALGNLKVTTTGDVVFGAAADVTAKGLSLRGDAITVQDVNTTGAQVYYGATTFNGVINALKLSITSTTDIINTGGAWVVTQLAALTAKGADISVTGAGNSFGELSLKGIDATVEEDGNMLVRSTALTGVLNLKTTAGAEVGNIDQGAARVKAFRLEADAAAGLNFLRPDTHLSQIGDLAAGADLTLLVRGARYVLLDGVISAAGDILLAANPFGRGTSFSTGGSAVSITAGGRWVVYSNHAEYPPDGTNLVDDLSPDVVISGQLHPFPAPVGVNVLIYQNLLA